jgi:hypothetical protein
VTVKELREALNQFDDDLEVDVEGCDCIGSASGAKIVTYRKVRGGSTKAILITRNQD